MPLEGDDKPPKVQFQGRLRAAFVFLASCSFGFFAGVLTSCFTTCSKVYGWPGSLFGIFGTLLAILWSER